MVEKKPNSSKKSDISVIHGGSGYTAPEYMMLGQLSEKADTYSFGVIVLEIISGRRCSDRSIEPYLLEWVIISI